MKYVKRSDKFSFIEKDNKVTIRKNLWGERIVRAVQIISFRRYHGPLYNGRMNVKMMEMAETVKLIVLIKKNTLTNFVSSWKLVLDFLQ